MMTMKNSWRKSLGSMLSGLKMALMATSIGQYGHLGENIGRWVYHLDLDTFMFVFH